MNANGASESEEADSGFSTSDSEDDGVGANSKSNKLLAEASLPQLTFKAIAAGLTAGTFGAFLAVYYGLKTGVTPSLNIISALLGFTVVRLLMKCGLCGGEYTPQETCVIQTTAVACTQVASSSGFSSGLLGMTLHAAELTQIPGSSLSDVVDLTWSKTVLWSSSIAFFGLFVAFPLRQYCIIERKLTFPSGTATATVIQTLHANPAHVRKSMRMLVQFGTITFCWNMFLWCFDGLSSFPIFGLKASKYGWTMDWDISQFAIGMLLGPNINLSTLAGAFMGNGLLQPWVQGSHECPVTSKADNSQACWYYSDAPKYLDLKAYTLFPGIAMVVVDGFYSIAKLVVVVGKGLVRPRDRGSDDSEEVDKAADKSTQEALNNIFHSVSFPWWMYLGGYAAAASSCVGIVSPLFGVVWYQVLLATLLTPIFAVGIIIGIGLTDWDVSSSFGKLMMFPLGAWNHGGSLIPSLAVCMITISGCGAAGALMQDFKTGYLLGASPKAMVAAQLVGAAAGCVIAPSIFQLFTSAFPLPNDDKHQFVHGVYGPIYRALAAITTSEGLGALPRYCKSFMLAFGCLALSLNLGGDALRRSLPAAAGYVPSTMGLSLGLLIGPYIGLDFCIGSLVQMLWRRHAPEEEEKYCVIVASGCLAGAGVATLAQVFLSLASVQAPVQVSYSAASSG